MEDAIRSAAFGWLKERSVENGGIYSRRELEVGFYFKARRITLVGPQGIWIPKGFESPISITTTTSGPYEDGFTDDGILRYSYQGNDPDDWDNKALRNAYRQRVPFIYFNAIQPGKYVAAWPIFVIQDNPYDLYIDAAIDVSLFDNGQWQTPSDEFFSNSDSILSVRKYMTRVTKQRLHQATFREFVLSAYNRKCTVCRLQHPELLDAAHIIPDSLEDGLPIVPNGLSLCKIHHSAYDQHILGISPDFRIHIRRDLLDEIDGPMLKHGFQELDGSIIDLPSRKKDCPDKDRLAMRFDDFKSA